MGTEETPQTNVSVDEITRCAALLETLLADRTQLVTAPHELRQRLLMAAGRLSRPERLEIQRLAKRHRRVKKAKLRMNDRSATATTAIREARKAEVFVAPAQVALPGPNAERKRLNNPRHCYVCKKPFEFLHFYYDSMCDECGDFNYAKRFQTAPLHGRVALITGARIKIGFQSALMCLRAGARVIVTTRFPHDAASRFSREEDYAQWSDRLEIHGLDLRHSPSVECFADYLCGTLDRLDFVINNAAQTVRRPPGFYRHLLEEEAKALHELPAAVHGPLSAYQGWKTLAIGTHRNDWVADLSTKGGAIGLRAPALMSQLAHKGVDLADTTELFPEGQRDADLQQVDKRGMNSWRMKLADVPTPELIEVQLVNSIAPFILCSKLKPVMMKHPSRDKHIINVSAMEGKFTRYTKTDKHPHTNMAKAALNMMTLTSAPDYAEDGIYMNAVDTGWVTDEDPIQLSQRKAEEHDFQPPLDIVDGAARVCDPIFAGLNTGVHVWGKFLKDYSPTAW